MRESNGVEWAFDRVLFNNSFALKSLMFDLKVVYFPDAWVVERVFAGITGI